MRGDVQAIFKETPHDKQVMMFSATLAKDIRAVCKKFMNKVRESWTPMKHHTAGHPQQAPVASSSPSSNSIPSMQSILRQQWQQSQRSPGKALALAAGCRGPHDARVHTPCHRQAYHLPCSAEQASVQLPAVGAG